MQLLKLGIGCGRLDGLAETFQVGQLEEDCLLVGDDKGSVDKLDYNRLELWGKLGVIAHEIAVCTDNIVVVKIL